MSPGCARDGASAEAAAIRQTLLHAMEGSAAAWNRGDLDCHVGLYTDSAAMMPEGWRILHDHSS